MAALKLLAAAAVAYVLVRAAWIFVGGIGVAIVALALAAAAYGGWRRGQAAAAAGLVGGALVSAVVLALG